MKKKFFKKNLDQYKKLIENIDLKLVVNLAKDLLKLKKDKKIINFW